MINIDDVKIKSNRYQKLNNEVVQQLAASIKEIGLKNPLIVTENKILVSGLHRLSALKKIRISTSSCDLYKYKRI